MNINAATLPEVMCRCREKSKVESVKSMSLIESRLNTADSLTRKNLKPALINILPSNKDMVPMKVDLMLKHRLYLYAKYIPTIQVPRYELIISHASDDTSLPYSSGKTSPSVNYAR